MKKTIILMLLALAGCAEGLNDQLEPYRYQQIDTLVTKLGMPSSEQTVMGVKAYIWRTNATGFSVDPVLSTTTGYVGTVPVSATSTSYVTSTSTLSCQLRVFATPNGYITNWDWEGNNGACLRFSSRLGR